MLYFFGLLQYACSFFITGKRSLRWSDTHRVLTIKKRPIIGTLVTYGAVVLSTFVTVPNVAIEINDSVEIKTVELHTTLALSDVEHTVRAYFKDTPILADVAWCESRFVHIDPHTGTVKRGHMNASDLGVMQINEYYHGTTAREMGLDLSQLEDNLAYARYLYEREGTKPWNASRFCWQDNLLAMR